MQILGAIGHVIWVSEPKTEAPIVGLNSSSSKTNHTRGIKVLNLEASGHAVLALKKLIMTISAHFFLYLFITQITLWEQKLRNHQSQKLEIWTDDTPTHELASLQFWRRYVMWFGADAP